MKRFVTVAIVGIALAAVLVLVASASTGSRPRGGIAVTGAGAATTTPDRAAFSFGVTDQAATATAALSRNSEAIAKVIAAPEAHGLASADTQTQAVSLSPRTSEKGAIGRYT